MAHVLNVKMHWSDNAYIMDTQTPIVIMIGPPCSGKTMVVHRLFRYLHSCFNGYGIDVDWVFWGALNHAEYV